MAVIAADLARSAHTVGAQGSRQPRLLCGVFRFCLGSMRGFLCRGKKDFKFSRHCCSPHIFLQPAVQGMKNPNAARCVGVLIPTRSRFFSAYFARSAVSFHLTRYVWRTAVAQNKHPTVNHDLRCALSVWENQAWLRMTGKEELYCCTVYACRSRPKWGSSQPISCALQSYRPDPHTRSHLQ